MNTNSKENYIAWLGFLLALVKIAQSTIVYGAYSMDAYQHIVDLGADKIYEKPLTVDDCYIADTVAYDMKTCHLVRENPQLLQQKASVYFSRALHEWRPRVEKHSEKPSWDSFRRKRRSSEDKVLSRKKRGIPGNPCIGYTPQQTVVMFAIDSETDEVLEVFQDPNGGQYQTFFTYGCTISFYGFLCKKQYVEFFSAVYTGHNYDVEVRQVKIATHCALSVGWQ